MDKEAEKRLQRRPCNPLVSVVVPVYNVKEFLPFCLDSLLAQTYPNLHIVLVDDGSTDGSGLICDRYKDKHSKFVVVHQSNVGLSGARNTGLLYAKGAYIVFVDADDIVASDCIQRAVKAIDATQADTVLFRYKLINERGDIIYAPHIETNFPKKTVSGLEACSLLFERRFENYTWRQLTKTTVYRNNSIFFPLHRAFEDRYTTYKVLLQSKSVAFLSDQLYYYRQREGSIVHSRNSQYLLDDLLALSRRSEYINEYAPSLVAQCKSNAYSSYIGIYRTSLLCTDNKSNVRRIRNYIYENIHFSLIVSLPLLPMEKRLQLVLIKTRLMLFLRPVIDLFRKWTGHAF